MTHEKSVAGVICGLNHGNSWIQECYMICQVIMNGYNIQDIDFVPHTWNGWKHELCYFVLGYTW